MVGDVLHHSIYEWRNNNAYKKTQKADKQPSQTREHVCPTKTRRVVEKGGGDCVSDQK